MGHHAHVRAGCTALPRPRPNWCRGPPKPELIRLVVDLQAGTCSARVLSQRAVPAATLGAGHAATCGSPAAPGRPPHRFLFASASASDDSENWGPAQASRAEGGCQPPGCELTGHLVHRALANAERVSHSRVARSELCSLHACLPAVRAAPLHTSQAACVACMATTVLPNPCRNPLPIPGPQVLTKLIVPTNHGVPSLELENAEEDSGNGSAPAAAGHRRQRRRQQQATAAQVWTPGDRVLLGPPIFLPRGCRQPAAGAPAAAGQGLPDRHGLGSTGPGLPGLTHVAAQTVAAAATAAAAASAAVSAAAAEGPREPQGSGADEDDGWLVVVAHDAESKTAELLILDARDITAGPVAVAALPHHLPLPNRACHTARYCGPARGAPEGWTPTAGQGGTGAARTGSV